MEIKEDLIFTWLKNINLIDKYETLKEHGYLELNKISNLLKNEDTEVFKKQTGINISKYQIKLASIIEEDNKNTLFKENENQKINYYKFINQISKNRRPSPLRSLMPFMLIEGMIKYIFKILFKAGR
jgi:hypothetical protein